MDSLVLDTAIGLVFVFATFAVVVSLVTEMVSRFMGLRGEYLLRGLRTLLDSDHTFELKWRDLFKRTPGEPDAGPTPAISQLLALDYIKSAADKGEMPPNAGNARLINKQRRQLPSYLSGRSFARAIIDLTVPNASGQTTVDDIAANLNNLPDSPVKSYLAALAKTVGTDVDKIRQGLAEYYDDHMARVSGWYKRHVRWVSLFLGALLVLAFNVNAVQITRSLYTDQTLRESVVTRAVEAADCGTQDPKDCLDKVRAEIANARDAGLPIGWAGSDVTCDSGPCPWLEGHGLANPTDSGWADVLFFLLVLVGWSIMVLALLPGARFWFDLLAKMGSLRSTGPKPPLTT